MPMNLPDFLTRNEFGEIRLAGHRIALWDVVELYEEGASADAILCEYPTLSLLLIHKVIVFYLENRSEVDAYVAARRAEVDRLASLPQSGPNMAELRRRLEAKRSMGAI